MATLPKDVMFDIFSRLPAKFLIRFKIVCKLWHDLINDPDFIKIHLDRSLTTQSNLHCITQTPIFHLADFDTFDNPVELDYPFKRPDFGGATVVGSCHGLLCCWNYERSLFLYNPTTQTHKMLPFGPVASQFGFPNGEFNYGFGHDGFSGDYKCVRILQACDKDMGLFESEVMVYCMKADSWRRVQDLPYNFYRHSGRSALVHGAIHWVGEDESRRVYLPIVSFDLKDETFGSLSLPNFDDEHHHIRMSVGELDECLCLLDNELEFYDVWILKEYGKPESWRKLFTIRKRQLYEHVESIVSYSITKKELLLTFSLGQTVKLDIETMEATDMNVVGSYRSLYTWVCVENLVMLNDDPPSEQEHGRKRRKGAIRRRKRKRNNRRLT